MPRYGRIDKDYARRLATCDPAVDGPIFMLNLMKYRATADYGAAGPADGGVSGREADDRYAPVDVLEKIGAAPVFLADVVDASEDWDRVAVARYPTRTSFIEMQSRPDFQEKHVHKDAGMDHTTVMGTLPVDGLPVRAKPRRILLEVWHDAEPSPLAPGAPTVFAVEGTIIGDDRRWTGARYTTLDGDAPIDLSAATESYQLLVVRPVLERWA